MCLIFSALNVIIPPRTGDSYPPEQGTLIPPNGGLLFPPNGGLIFQIPPNRGVNKIKKSKFDVANIHNFRFISSNSR